METSSLVERRSLRISTNFFDKSSEPAMPSLPHRAKSHFQPSISLQQGATAIDLPAPAELLAGLVPLARLRGVARGAPRSPVAEATADLAQRAAQHDDQHAGAEGEQEQDPERRMEGVDVSRTELDLARVEPDDGAEDGDEQNSADDQQ